MNSFKGTKNPQWGTWNGEPLRDKDGNFIRVGIGDKIKLSQLYIDPPGNSASEPGTPYISAAFLSNMLPSPTGIDGTGDVDYSGKVFVIRGQEGVKGKLLRARLKKIMDIDDPDGGLSAMNIPGYQFVNLNPNGQSGSFQDNQFPNRINENYSSGNDFSDNKQRVIEIDRYGVKNHILTAAVNAEPITHVIGETRPSSAIIGAAIVDADVLTDQYNIYIKPPIYYTEARPGAPNLWRIADIAGLSGTEVFASGMISETGLLEGWNPNWWILRSSYAGAFRVEINFGCWPPTSKNNTGTYIC